MTGYRVTHFGDSISAMSFGFQYGPGGVIVSDNTYRNLNHGRSAYAWGQQMPHSNGSTWQMALLNLPRTDEFCVVQDNSLDAGTDWHWSKLCNDIVDITPPHVTLVGVVPGWNDPDHLYYGVIRARAVIMTEAFKRHPKRRFCYLNAYMLDHPEQFPDGQHPDATAQAWIRSELTRLCRP